MNDLWKGRSTRHSDPQPGKETTSLQRISTRNERADRRFDYWRALHPHIDMDVVHKNARKDFRADLLRYAAPDGSTFGMASNEDVIARFAKPEHEFVLFSLTLAGSTKLTHNSKMERIVSPRSGFLVLDSTHPLTTVSKRHRHIYLSIPRARIINALNDDPNILCDEILVLPGGGVAELLKSHLLMIAREEARLDAQGLAAGVRCAVDLAVETLGQELKRSGHALSDGPTDTLYAAAYRYIQLHLSDSTLTTARVARAVGCSRAQLHRVFAERGEQAGQTIRHVRLEAARNLLTSSMDPSIDQVAYACGFGNASSFSRAFRNFAGMAPSAYLKSGDKS